MSHLSNSFGAFLLLTVMGGGLAPEVLASSVRPTMTITQQQDALQGVVTDANGEPVMGAAVRVKNSGRVSVTKGDGSFSIPGVKKGSVVVISFLGYDTQEVTWNGGPLKVTLQEKDNTLGEAVVVGFGTQKRVNMTGSISTVSAKEIQARPVNSTVEALQGVVPGMNFAVGSGGGALDSDLNFNIRGKGTIGSGSSVTPLVLIDGMEGDISTLNPQDIQNISILKDASTSSIYGSRAAGGVVLVTTKKGKEGKVSINYNNSFRFNSPLNMPEMMNSYEYALFFNAAGHSTMFTDAKLQQIKDNLAGKGGPTMYANPKTNRWEVWDNLDLLPSGNTDWLKYHFGNSFSQEHTLSISGGSQKMQYYFSANYLQRNGMLKQAKDDRNRYAFTGRINSELAPWAHFGYTTRFNREDFERPSFVTPLFYHNACRYWPIVPTIDPNGHPVRESYYEMLNRGGLYNIQQDNLDQQFSLILEPIKNWTINTELNYRASTTFRHEDYQTVYAWDVNNNPYATDNQTSSVTEYAYKSNYFNPNIYSTYLRSFGDHNFKVMAGFQSEWFHYRNVKGSRDGILSRVPTLNTTSSNPRVEGGLASWSTAGFFGRLNYNYAERYLVEASLRYDGSSRFIRSKRWNLFPSFSLGWNVSKENFWKPIEDKINNLKLRFTWGKLGNQNTDNWYPFYSTIGYSANAGNWLLNGEKQNLASEPALVSALLTWEKTRTWDLGVDFGAFNNRLTTSFTYFQRKTLDMVGPAPELPDVLGTAVPKVNNLDMTSKGWELTLGWRDHINDFFYGADLMLSDNQVVIDRYPNAAKDLSQTYYKGAHLGDIWGYVTEGMAKTQEEMDAHLKNANQDALGSNWRAGDIMYKDLNGDKKINTGQNTANDSGDRKIIGNSTPRYNFGLNLTASYKGFDLKVFFQGVLKRDYWPGAGGGGVMFWGASGGKWQSVAFKEHLDYFRADANDPLGQNLNAYYPEPDWSTQKNQQAQTRYLQNAAYCRLKNVTLGYTLPEALTQRFYVQKVRFFVSAENLLTFTKFTKMGDPELIDAGGWGFSKTYPLSKTWSVGVSVTF